MSCEESAMNSSKSRKENVTRSTMPNTTTNNFEETSLNSYNNGPNGFGRINLMSSNSSTVNFNGKNHNTKLFVNNNLIIYKFFNCTRVELLNTSLPILLL